MRGFYYPQSAAVIGVSPKRTNLGRAISTNLINHGFSGRLHFVGRSGGVLYGQRIVPSVADIDDAVDCAIIITPASTVPGFVEECGAAGIKRVIIESGGFSEFDSSRAGLEGELIEAARRHGIRFIGPNGIGVFNLDNRFVVPFPAVSTSLPKGGVSIIAQSGGVGLTYVNALHSEAIGINKFASVGNKLNVDECDLLEYFISDDETQVIAMYLESISNGRRLMDLAEASDKPILIHKSNTSPLSGRIAASHTASLAADDAVVEAAFNQAGIIRVRRIGDMINHLKILTQPPLRGRRLGIVSRSGGHAVIAADACAAAGLELPQMPRDFLEEIETHFRGGVIKIQNPIDLGDLFDFSVYIGIAEGIISRDEVDGMLFVHGYRGAETPHSRKFVDAVASMAEKYDKPIALCLLAEESEMAFVKKHFHFPVFSSPEDATACLDVSHRAWQRAHRRPPIRPEEDYNRAAVAEILTHGKPGLVGSLRLAEAAGIAVAPWRAAEDRAGLLAAAGELGGPLALKAASAQVSHKSDVGGVLLNLEGAAAVEAALDGLTANLAAAGQDEPWPVVVQEMVGGGEEVILGGRQDPDFGPVILLGLGGVFVEIMGDVALGIAPVDETIAAGMLDRLAGGRILDGVRGRPAVDKQALIKAAVRLSALLTDFPEIKEIDLNPIRVLPQGRGAVAVDARVIV